MHKEVKPSRVELRRVFTGDEAAAAHSDGEFFEHWVAEAIVQEFFRSSKRPEFKPGYHYQIKLELSEWQEDGD